MVARPLLGCWPELQLVHAAASAEVLPKVEMSLIGASFHKSMSTTASSSAMASSRSASERRSMTMASSQRATASRQSDVSISVQDYSLERPRGSTPPAWAS